MKLKILSSIRTHNFNDPEMMTKIKSLWITNQETVNAEYRSGKPVRVVYHDYESNYEGNYVMSLCVSNENSYDFDTSINRWKHFTVDSQNEAGIADAWRLIWDMEKSGNLKRTYTFDYETYNADGSVLISISEVESL